MQRVQGGVFDPCLEVDVNQSLRAGNDAAPIAENESARHQPVAIVGMHRSGTSMVAQMLQQAGLHLGPDEALMPPAEENAEGFFEHLDFVRLNDEILNAAGAGWDCPPVSDFDWSSANLQPFRERAAALAAPLQDQAPWGWKDPRTSLTLPFWQSALGPLRTVVVVRNPLEVVTSLHRRNGFSIALGLTLWRIYAERILAATTPADRLITHYDTYFVDPAPEIERLIAFIGLEPRVGAESHPEAAAPQLRHHRKTLRDLAEHGFPREVIALYRGLCQEAGWWEGGVTDDEIGETRAISALSGSDTIARGTGAVDLLRVENLAIRRSNDDFLAALAHRDARIAELEIALRGHESARTELEGKVAERDGRLHERHQVLARKDHAFGVLQQQLAAATAEIAGLRAAVEDFKDRLTASERARSLAEMHERDLRAMLTSLQDVQLQRDAEIMGTLGAALSRFAPGAPAAIYHRRLVDQVRRQADAHLPPGSRVLVATYGDPAMLQLGNRQTEPFPRAASGVSADYTDISDEAAIAQLESLHAGGAEYLVVPGPAMPWLVNHPGLQQFIDDRFTVVAQERGVITIYALGRQQGQIPA